MNFSLRELNTLLFFILYNEHFEHTDVEFVRVLFNLKDLTLSQN